MYYFKGLTFIQFRIQYTEQNPYVLFHHQFLVGGAGRGGDADDVGAGRQRRDVEGGGEAVDGGAQMALSVEVEQLDVAYAERQVQLFFFAATGQFHQKSHTNNNSTVFFKVSQSF